MLNQHKLLTSDRVRPILRGRFGEPYFWSETCSSTQDALRDASLPEGAVAVTEHQDAGRGREGRAWADVTGRSLLLSVLLRPPGSGPAEQLSLVAGLAVAEAIDATTGTRSQVKWPNDVLLEGRKVAGILLEAAGGVVICGIGVNVDQTEEELPVGTRLPATSLRVATGGRPERADLLVELLGTLERRYDAWLGGGLAPLLPELEGRHALRGRRVRLGDETGTVGQIAPDGRLTLTCADGTVVLITSGEVYVLEEPVSD